MATERRRAKAATVDKAALTGMLSKRYSALRNRCSNSHRRRDANGSSWREADGRRNKISGAILSYDWAARLVAICPLPIDLGRLEHYLLQAISIGDKDHKVEFAILLHQTS